MYNITYELDGINSAILVDTDYMEIAKRIFWKKYPYAKMTSIAKASSDDIKHDKQVLSL